MGCLVCGPRVERGPCGGGAARPKAPLGWDSQDPGRRASASAPLLRPPLPGHGSPRPLRILTSLLRHPRTQGAPLSFPHISHHPPQSPRSLLFSCLETLPPEQWGKEKEEIVSAPRGSKRQWLVKASPKPGALTLSGVR